MMLTEIDHVAIAVSDLEAAIDYYQRAFGARVDHREIVERDGVDVGGVVVGLDGAVRIMNPAARRLLNLEGRTTSGEYRAVIDEPALSQTIDECLATGAAVVRRTVHLPEGRIGEVKAGQAARVYLDSKPDAPIDAVVTRIDPEATFTPENTYFRDDRVKQVVGVKVQLKGAVGFAKPGMPADGYLGEAP